MKILVRQQNSQENHKFNRKRARTNLFYLQKFVAWIGRKNGIWVVNYDRKLNRKLLCELKTFFTKKYRNLSTGSAGKKLLMMHVSIK